MYLVKYGVRFYSNRYNYDILIFKSLDDLGCFKCRIDNSKKDIADREFIHEYMERLDKYNSMDLKRKRLYFIDDIIEQIVVGNYVFDMINMGDYLTLIIAEIVDPFINEFE